MTVPPSHQDQIPKLPVYKPRRGEGWALALAALILLGLFGHLLNQQRASKPTSDVESLPREPAPATSTTETSRRSASNNTEPAKPSQVAYVVTHKHRLRDCHGTLTFTREGLRFESDAPQDSFAVGIADVTADGDAVRIHDKTWRFEFADGVRTQGVFQDWKKGILRPASPPSRVK